MTRLFTHEPITVRVNDTGRPLSFVWLERKYLIERIIQRWEVDTDWWEVTGRIWRQYTALITTCGVLCVIYWDMVTEQWMVEKVYD